jgi:hypothetical protein
MLSPGESMTRPPNLAIISDIKVRQSSIAAIVDISFSPMRRLYSLTSALKRAESLRLGLWDSIQTSVEFSYCAYHRNIRARSCSTAFHINAGLIDRLGGQFQIAAPIFGKLIPMLRLSRSIGNSATSQILGL